MPGETTIKVEGIRDLQRQLRQLETGLDDELKDAHTAIAKIVEADARQRAPVKTGRTRASIRGSGTKTAAVIRGGKKLVPYYGWIDFGGVIAPKGTPIQRQFRKSGRILYPAIGAMTSRIVALYQRALQDTIRKAGL